MKELIRVRVKYASRQQCCKTHKRPLPLTFLEVRDVSLKYLNKADIIKFLPVLLVTATENTRKSQQMVTQKYVNH